MRHSRRGAVGNFFAGGAQAKLAESLGTIGTLAQFRARMGGLGDFFGGQLLALFVRVHDIFELAVVDGHRWPRVSAALVKREQRGDDFDELRFLPVTTPYTIR